MNLHEWVKDKVKFTSFDADKYTCSHCGEKMNLNGLATGNMPEVHYEKCTKAGTHHTKTRTE